MKKIFRCSIIVASFIAGFSLTTGILAYGSSKSNEKVIYSDREKTQIIQHSHKKYDVNANGQTYGTVGDVIYIEDYPDLIAVMGDNEKVGYAYKEDFLGPDMTPDEVDKYMESVNNGTYVPRSFNVYESDGVTVIDTMTEKLS
ncbi:hypothetical protein [Ruminococcus sp.]|uniref:hypothetical protein n=1 Tax=Ruminococcus sp. TaxID=41978 RepID=UPI0025E3D0B2|nr:hypothetical protein [Ruminococcus sp.]